MMNPGNAMQRRHGLPSHTCCSFSSSGCWRTECATRYSYIGPLRFESAIS